VKPGAKAREGSLAAPEITKADASRKLSSWQIRKVRAGVKVMALITMYYRFNWFKKWGFRTVPRAKLPDHIACFPDFTSKRYMKCAVMLSDKLAGSSISFSAA